VHGYKKPEHVISHWHVVSPPCQCVERPVIDPEHASFCVIPEDQTLARGGIPSPRRRHMVYLASRSPLIHRVGMGSLTDAERDHETCGCDVMMMSPALIVTAPPSSPGPPTATHNLRGDEPPGRARKWNHGRTPAQPIAEPHRRSKCGEQPRRVLMIRIMESSPGCVLSTASSWSVGP
jgi:hypothetical protein